MFKSNIEVVPIHDFGILDFTNNNFQYKYFTLNLKDANNTDRLMNRRIVTMIPNVPYSGSNIHIQYSFTPISTWGVYYVGQDVTVDFWGYFYAPHYTNYNCRVFLNALII